MATSVSSLNYIGAKKQLLPFLDSVITPSLAATDVFCDLFAGSGIVSCYFANKARFVISNDIEQYSYIINSAFLRTPYTDKLQGIINDINANIASITNDTISDALNTDIIYHNFSPTSSCERMFFTNNNALRIDKARQYI